MATREQLDATYGYMDEVFRLTFGPAPDITAALFDGDFSKTIEQAQRDKHEYILHNLGFAPGARILDVGCGWGPLLKAVQERGGRGVGVCLSTRQAAACRQQGFEVYLEDWKTLGPETLGRFDAVASVGSLEHFCSDEEYFAGRQEDVYRSFFHFCKRLLDPGRRLYVQTMTWGKNAPRFEAVSLDAPRGSTEYIVALVQKFYPGSFLPFGVPQLARCAAPHFRVVSTKNGRLDYIETMNRWNAVFRPTPAKLAAAVRLLPYLIRDRDFFRRFELLLGSWNQECFKREIIDHERIVFERV
jgi:cyclopropane-fatty-acyl-phospholipid synthase